MGFFRFLGKVAFYAGIFTVVHAIHGCIREDSRYDIRRYEGKPYLLDKDSAKIVEILDEDKKMRLGDLEYLVDSSLDDSRIEEYISRIKYRFEEK